MNRGGKAWDPEPSVCLASYNFRFYNKRARKSRLFLITFLIILLSRTSELDIMTRTNTNAIRAVCHHLAGSNHTQGRS
jgi:hypothetical protein